MLDLSFIGYLNWIEKLRTEVKKKTPAADHAA